MLPSEIRQPGRSRISRASISTSQSSSSRKKPVRTNRSDSPKTASAAYSDILCFMFYAVFCIFISLLVLDHLGDLLWFGRDEGAGVVDFLVLELPDLAGPLGLFPLLAV